MSSSSAPRFLLRTEDGSEIPVASVEALSRRVERGDVDGRTPLFDASTGSWTPAGESAVFRFIVEELTAGGWTPREGFVLEPEEAARPVAQEAEAVGADALDFDFTLEPATAGTDAVEVAPPEPAPEAAEGEEEPDFDFDPGFIIEPPLQAEPSVPPIPEVEGPAEVREEEEGDLTFTFEPPPGEPPPHPHAPPTPAEEAQGEGMLDGDWLVPSGSGARGEPAPVRDESEVRAPSPRAAASDGWTPEPEGSRATVTPAATAPRRQSSPARLLGLFVVFLLLSGWLMLADGWSRVTEFMAAEPTPRSVGTTVVASEIGSIIEVPRPPAGLERDVNEVLASIQNRFREVVDSLRADLGIEEMPPSEWLSGRYLGNASQFSESPLFWERYGELIDRMRLIDRSLYASTVRGRVRGGDGLTGDPAALEAYFIERYATLVPARRERLDYLESAARNAVLLHEFLLEHEAEILHTPALGSSVPLDPVLEAGSRDPRVQREMEYHLDLVLSALDRSRQGGAPSPEGLRSDLFRRFGEG